MSDQVTGDAEKNLQQMIVSARNLGVEMNETEATAWLTAIAAWKTGSDIAVDTTSGVFGHKVTMLDFSSDDLAFFRAVGKIVEIPDRPGVVESALALSGSAAQSKIQSYPGDCDYFERVNIKAPTREEACAILSDVMRSKALSTLKGSTFRFIECKYGNFPKNVLKEGSLKKAGSYITWLPDEILGGEMKVSTPEGEPFVIRWDDLVNDPGWCKLDWVVADPVHGRLSNASNVLDVTWESPQGDITPLDGYLDPYFQEVYLEAESIPVFSKIAKHVAADAMENYVQQLEKEVKKYLGKDPRNYGKAAKRMYNIFRLTGRYNEAAFLRELFDEPATVLYQVWSLVRTIEEASTPDSTISKEAVMAQTDQLIFSAIKVLEGEDEQIILRSLLKLRDSISSNSSDSVARNAEVEFAQTEVIKLVNTFFSARMNSVPSILAYMNSFSSD